MRIILSFLLLLLAGCSSTFTSTQSNPILSQQIINPDASYPQSHASTIVETTDGELVAAWFGGLHERHPEVAIYAARFTDGQWQQAKIVVTGKQENGTFLPTWNPVLFQPPGAPLQLFYKVGPNPREWWGMVTSSNDGGISWTHPRRLPDAILGPIKNKPVLTGMGSWLSPASTETPDGWALHFEYSADQGATWQQSQKVARGPDIDAIQPSILTHADGRLQAVARTRQGVIASTWSYDRGKSWSPLAAIDLPNPNSGTDAVTLQDGRQLLVYNHAAHSPQTPGKGPRFPLNIALSNDGLNWFPVLTLEDKPLKEGYAYPAVIQSKDGLVHITYTVGRKAIKHIVVDPSRLLARRASSSS